MRWERGRRSGNVEDRRGQGGGFGRGGGFGGRGLRIGGRGGLGLGGIAIVVVLGLLFGVDPRLLLGMVDGGGGGYGPVPGQEQEVGLGPATGPGADPAQDELAEFVKVTLAYTEDVWNPLFARQGLDYQEPVLVLFSGMVESGCGRAQAAMGPFYCPLDERLYIDLDFYRELRSRLGAPGDFAQAYVIAHEVGHHVQNLLDISDQVQEARQRLPEAEANALSVRLELQADCLAGVWAHHAQAQLGVLEPGDIEEALAAAAAVGDDRLQRRAGGAVVPDSFTHGSSEQRAGWFGRGLEEGTMEACDTFAEEAGPAR